MGAEDEISQSFKTEHDQKIEFALKTTNQHPCDKHLQ